ncbi:protein of unknown function [Methylorubrum extorquens]|uniref:Uncharacterized protein n=1 Tax=Methylorubrum extorquens TaxID=408 RepID=A0A2N9AI39_METEX|nr:protein of unknown function [Methylorubrum extorquens]
MATLRDNQAAAGIEILPDEGRVRIAAVARLEAETGERLTSLSVLVDALKGQIDLYGSVQGKDVSGLVTDINAVRVRLDAVAATVSTLATSAQFDGVSARLGTAEQTITAQGAAIEQRATLAAVNAQGTLLTTAMTRISAAEGSIRNVVTAAGTSAVDLPLMVGTLAQMLDYLGEQTGGLYEHVARAETATSANFDEAGRAVAEVSTRLLTFQGDTAAQFVDVTPGDRRQRRGSCAEPDVTFGADRQGRSRRHVGDPGAGRGRRGADDPHRRGGVTDRDRGGAARYGGADARQRDQRSFEPPDQRHEPGWFVRGRNHHPRSSDHGQLQQRRLAVSGHIRALW